MTSINFWLDWWIYLTILNLVIFILFLFLLHIYRYFTFTFVKNVLVLKINIHSCLTFFQKLTLKIHLFCEFLLKFKRRFIFNFILFFIFKHKIFILVLKLFWKNLILMPFLIIDILIDSECSFLMKICIIFNPSITLRIFRWFWSLALIVSNHLL